MKKLLAIFIFLICSNIFGQIVKFKSEGFAIVKKMNGKFNFPKFENDDTLIVLNLNEDKMTLYRSEYETIFDIYKTEKKVYLENGDEMKNYYAIDEDGLKCKIMFIYISTPNEKRNYNRQIYIIYENTQAIFNVNNIYKK